MKYIIPTKGIEPEKIFRVFKDNGFEGDYSVNNGQNTSPQDVVLRINDLSFPFHLFSTHYKARISFRAEPVREEDGDSQRKTRAYRIVLSGTRGRYIEKLKSELEKATETE